MATSRSRLATALLYVIAFTESAGCKPGIKERHMKHIRNFAFGIVLVLSVAAAQAQSKLAANVPFDFQLGDKQMSAGHYTADVNGSTVLVRGTEGGAFALSMRQAKKVSEREQCKLVFRRNGSSLYLAEIWSPSIDTVARIARPKHAEIVARNTQP